MAMSVGAVGSPAVSSAAAVRAREGSRAEEARESATQEAAEKSAAQKAPVNQSGGTGRLVDVQA